MVDDKFYISKYFPINWESQIGMTMKAIFLVDTHSAFRDFPKHPHLPQRSVMKVIIVLQAKFLICPFSAEFDSLLKCFEMPSIISSVIFKCSFFILNFQHCSNCAIELCNENSQKSLN